MKHAPIGLSAVFAAAACLASWALPVRCEVGPRWTDEPPAFYSQADRNAAGSPVPSAVVTQASPERSPVPSDVPAAATPPAPAAEGKPWHSAITFSVFAEASYSWNFNRPGSKLNTYRVFDFDDRKLKLDLVEFVVQRPAVKPSEFGFRVDAAVGQSVPEITAAWGLFRDRETGEAHDYDLHQFFASFVAPVGKGLKIDGGKFFTSFGYEVVEGRDVLNDNQTRSILFGYALPATHTGARITYPFTDKISATAHIVQGWDDFHDNNHGKSIGFQLAAIPFPNGSLLVTAMDGPERPDCDDRRFVVETVATWKATEHVSLAGDAVYGTETGAGPAGSNAKFGGAAFYVRVAATPRLSFAGRAEVFNDGDGARTGTAQTLWEMTLTPEVRLGKHVVARGDLRRDMSDVGVFETRSAFTRHQTTVSAAVLFLY